MSISIDLHINPYQEGDWTCVGRASFAGGELADKLGNIREAGQACSSRVVETAAGSHYIALLQGACVVGQDALRFMLLLILIGIII